MVNVVLIVVVVIDVIFIVFVVVVVVVKVVVVSVPDRHSVGTIAGPASVIKLQYTLNLR